MQKLYLILVASHLLLFTLAPAVLSGQNETGREKTGREAVTRAADAVPPPELAYDYDDEIRVAVGVYPDPGGEGAGLEAYANKLFYPVRTLEENKYFIRDITLIAYLPREKDLSREKLARRVEGPFVSEFVVDGEKVIVNFGRNNGLLENKWELELYRLARLKEEISRMAQLDAGSVKLNVDTRNSSLKRPKIEVGVNASINYDALSKAMKAPEFFAGLSARMERLFNGVVFDVLENTRAHYDSREKRLEFVFSNYETAFKGLPDVGKYLSFVKPVIDELRSYRELERVQFQLDSYDEKAFFTFPSEQKYNSEFDPKLTLAYSFGCETGLMYTVINPGPISILQQELLKLYELKDELKVEKDKASYKINYDTKGDYIETKVIIYHK